ncbi:MAG TPA: 30S ribosomal protein S6 [bacterium]|nr:30S ribosomal protein S6 [bacterium]
MVKQYETTFIVDAHLQGEEIEAAVTKYSQLIEKQGGKIRLLDRWGKRRLAYEIDKKQYGYYVYIRFEAEGSLIGVLEKEFRIDETILRFLVLAVPKVMVRAEADAPVKPLETEQVDSKSEDVPEKEGESEENSEESEES